MIRLLLVDDQEVVTEGLKAMLRAAPGIEVIGTARNGAEAVSLVESLHPDIVLMDLKMPIMNGIQATQLIRQRHADTQVLVLTTYDSDEWLFDAIRSGAAGYLLKDTPREQLIAAIQGTMAGDTYIDPHVAGKLLTQVAPGRQAADQEFLAVLSERELDVLKLLARGLSNTDIARILFLSEGTVRNYVSAIFSKLHVTDRTQAAVIALRNGLVDLSEI